MQPQELESVVADVYRKTYELWEASRDRLTSGDHGFKILYAPPRLEPSVLVMEFQPGGDKSNIRDAELRQPSTSNEYLSESWTLAAQLRKRLGAQFLQGAVGTNAIFFRAPNSTQWRKNVEEELRTQLELFCIGENKRLIRAMRPKRILLLGWDALGLMGGSDSESWSRSRR